ncbi:MAG: helix-turn-helix domain-containing protein [Dehalococcoidia bacterium]
MTEQAQRMTDSHPEYSEYRDEGCDLFPSCLRCPLPRCRHDEQSSISPAKRLRDREMLRQRRLAGRSTTELADIFGVSRRTVQRIIRRS